MVELVLHVRPQIVQDVLAVHALNVNLVINYLVEIVILALEAQAALFVPNQIAYNVIQMALA